MLDHEHPTEDMTDQEQQEAFAIAEQIGALVQGYVLKIPQRLRSAVVGILGHSLTCNYIDYAPCAACATHKQVTAIVAHAISIGAFPPVPKGEQVAIKVDVGGVPGPQGTRH